MSDSYGIKIRFLDLILGFSDSWVLNFEKSEKSENLENLYISHKVISTRVYESYMNELV